MRSIIFFIICSLVLACAAKKRVNSKSDLLNGTWIPISQEMNGKALPASVFENQKLILVDSTYTVSAESTDKGIVIYSKGKMDIYGKDGVNAGNHFTAIYKLENDQLTICYNLAGNIYPENFETTGKPMYFMSVFKK